MPPGGESEEVARGAHEEVESGVEAVVYGGGEGGGGEFVGGDETGCAWGGEEGFEGGGGEL